MLSGWPGEAYHGGLTCRGNGCRGGREILGQGAEHVVEKPIEGAGRRFSSAYKLFAELLTPAHREDAQGLQRSCRLQTLSI